jgi:hypothetical protein
VCVWGNYRSGSVLLSCKSVDVPHAEAGAIQSAAGVVGGIQVSGWALNQVKSTSTYVWVNVDGSGGPLLANQPNAAAKTSYPAVSGNHGFSGFFKAKPGQHQVCVTGTDESTAFGCRTVTVPTNEVGTMTATGVLGGVQVSGWDLNQLNSASTYVWVNVDGSGGALPASLPNADANAKYPSVSGNHGYSGFFAAAPGDHNVCVTGTTDNVSLGCQTVTVPKNEVGSLDTATGVYGGVQVSGWDADRLSTRSTSVNITVDGKTASTLPANKFLEWINAYFNGVTGDNHGFSGTVPASIGTHTVCAVGTYQGASLGCKTVTVPSPVASSFDTATGVSGGIHVTGWAVNRTNADLQYVWVSVDGGAGAPIAAGSFLDWINAYFNGVVGDNHGFDQVIAASSGTHQICLTETTDNSPMGCKTVTVP